MSLKVGKTYDLFNITGDQLVEKVIKWGSNNRKISEMLEEIKVRAGYVSMHRMFMYQTTIIIYLIPIVANFFYEQIFDKLIWI